MYRTLSILSFIIAGILFISSFGLLFIALLEQTSVFKPLGDMFVPIVFTYLGFALWGKKQFHINSIPLHVYWFFVSGYFLSCLLSQNNVILKTIWLVFIIVYFVLGMLEKSIYAKTIEN